MGVLQNAVSVVWLYDLASVVDDSLWLQFSAKKQSVCLVHTECLLCEEAKA